MKKIAKFLFAAVAMIAAASCAKELTEDIRPEIQIQGKAYTFKATLAPETKTVLDESTMKTFWKGDEEGNEYIAVMEQVLNTATEAEDDYITSVNKYVAAGLTEPVSEAVFNLAENGGPGLAGKAAFAVYPYGAWTCFSTEKAVGLNVTYASQQQAVPNTYDPKGAVAVAYNADVEASQVFNFKNASALLKFTIHDSSDPIYSVTVSSLAGEPISGAMVLQEEVVEGEKKGTISGAKTGALNSVTLSDIAESRALLTSTAYYIAVAPAVLSKGIAVQFNDDDIQTFTISREIKIERSKIYDLGMFSYVDPVDDSWYLIGNFAEGNPNKLAQTPLKYLDRTFYGVEGLEIKAGQSFKIYNQVTNESYCTEAPVVSRVLTPLVSEDGYIYITEDGKYDIYVSCMTEDPETYEEIFEFVNIYVVNRTAKALETPAFKNIIWKTAEGQEKVMIFGKDKISFAKLEGNTWILETEVEGAEITAIDKTSGEITWVVNDYGWMSYYKIKYSNLKEASVELLSLNSSNKMTNYDPVFNSDGDFVEEKYWMGWDYPNLFYTEDYETFETIEATLSSEDIQPEFDSPLGKQYTYDGADGITYLLDLGFTEQGTVLKGTSPDWGEHYYKSEVLGDGLKVVPTDATSGTISWSGVSIAYTEFTEWSVMFTSQDIPGMEAGAYASPRGRATPLDYAKPDKMQLMFNLSGETYVNMIDLGVTYSDYLALAVNYDIYSSSMDKPEVALSGWYYTGSDSYWKYEVVASGVGEGVIKLAKNGSTIELPYSGYVDKETPFILDASDLNEANNLELTPSMSKLDVYIEGVTPMPEPPSADNSIEGKQWTYSDGDEVYLFDCGFTTPGTIYLGTVYEGACESYERYENIKIVETGIDSGVITFVSYVTFWGETTKEYKRIEYSKLRASSLSLFSPSYFSDSEGNDLEVKPEDLESGDEGPYFWTGVGINDYGSHTNFVSLPLKYSVAESPIKVTYVEEDGGIDIGPLM